MRPPVHNISVSFKNCRYSKALEESIESHFEDAVTLLRNTDVLSVHVTISEENGVLTPGADVFQCVLIAHFSAGKSVRFALDGVSPYDCVEKLFASFRRKLTERKRRRVQVRNDVRTNLVRVKVGNPQ